MQSGVRNTATTVTVNAGMYITHWSVYPTSFAIEITPNIRNANVTLNFKPRVVEPLCLAYAILAPLALFFVDLLKVLYNNKLTNTLRFP